MADINDVKSVSDLLTEVTQGFKDFFTNLNGMLENLAGIPNLLSGADNNLNKVRVSALNLNNTLDITKTNTLGVINSFNQLGTDSVKTFDAIINSTHEGVDNLGYLNKGLTTVISTMGLLTLGGTNIFSSLNDSTNIAKSNINDTFIPVLNTVINKLSGGGNSGLAKDIKEIATFGATSIDSVNNLENSLLALHAQTGDLINTLQKTGSTESDLTKLTDEYTSAIARTALQTGTSISSVIQYSKEIIKIPGLYNDIIKTPLGENLSFTEAAIKLTRGTTQDFGITLDIVRQQMLNFAESGEKPLELISRMYNVSNSLEIPFNYIQGEIKQVSEQFKFLGDNTEGALNIFNSLGEGLQKSKIGPAAISEIVQDVTGAIGQLDIAQKSFLSAQSGGAGGLQGGFQIDQLLSEGKIDEVYKKIEGTLRQEFGGKITTLKEGASNATDAQQLIKEVSFLRQGPFGQVVKSDQEAYKLLEAFKTGTTAPKNVPTENQLQAGLSKSLDTGTAIQQNQYTELQKISNNTEIFRLYAQKELGQNLREVARTDLGRIANPTSLEEATKNAVKSGKAELYAGTDLVSGVKDVYNKIANSDLLKPTNVEINSGRTAENIISPKAIQEPDLNAEINRDRLLKDNRTTQEVKSGIGGDQTLYIKVQVPGPDGKMEDRIVAKATANTMKSIQTYDHNSAIVGHQ